MRFLLLALIPLLGTCVRAQTTVAYQPSPADFPNPERGFYVASATRSENYTPVNANYLAGLQTDGYTAFGANYSVRPTLLFRYFFLKDFVDGPISQAYLDDMAFDFAAIRQAGYKVIPRFAYTDEVDSDSCPDDFCPPYGDAPKAIVLQHIAQITPLLQANADIIATVQLGWVGIWGEGYYTDHFGDASEQGRLLDPQWQDRFEVISAMLAAVPANRTLQVRYPQFKQRYIYGVNAPTSSAPLTAGEAFTGTDKARIGLHNDCILASFTDFGTYEDYGNSAGFGGADTANLKPYLAADSRYVPVGGETCFAGFDPQNNCASSGGIADAEFRRMHYSYLNADYNNDVNNDWQGQGCMDAIKRELGYRLELQSGIFPNAIGQGGGATFSFTLRNEGYTAPYNERRAEIILRNTATGEVYLAPLNTDPRDWDRESAQHTVTEQLCVPTGMPAGTYDLLLNLPDAAPTLYQNPAYSIRLANRRNGAEVWEAATGYNDLGHQIMITAGGGNGCTGTEFVSLFASLPVEFTAVSARAREKQILVHWRTASETDNDYFTVERRSAAGPFATLGTVRPGSGDYQFADREVAEGVTYYYRIRQTDLDGTSSVSRTVAAALSSGAGLLSIHPNPTGGTFYLDRVDGDLRIYDQTGRAIDYRRDGREVQLLNPQPGLKMVTMSGNGLVLRARVMVR